MTMTSHYTRYGLGTAIILIGYFLFTKLLGWHEYPMLSAFNGVIYGAALYFALQSYKRATPSFRYPDGFQVGLFVGGIATLLFAAFMAVYVYAIDQEFARAVLDSWGLNFNKGSLIMIVSLVIMGFSTTFVLTLTFMQLLKKSWNQTAYSSES